VSFVTGPGPERRRLAPRARKGTYDQAHSGSIPVGLQARLVQKGRCEPRGWRLDCNSRSQTLLPIESRPRPWTSRPLLVLKRLVSGNRLGPVMRTAPRAEALKMPLHRTDSQPT
jgi:hypothetical protein